MKLKATSPPNTSSGANQATAKNGIRRERLRTGLPGGRTYLPFRI
ncbi:hypothetical protein [Nocardia mexicana]|nr:hypothetical protein [Nocardia mexicana]